MNVREIARALGGVRVGIDRVLAPGPGHSAGDRSMSVILDQRAPDGFRINSFAGDDWRDCRDYVRAAIGSGAILRYRSQMPHEGVQRNGDRLSAASALWNRAGPICATAAEVYLRTRGIFFDAGLPDALRFHPACPFRLDGGEIVRLPAMLASIVDIDTNAFCGIHRTALTADGTGKANRQGLSSPKKMLGRAAGACVKLTPDEDVSTGLYLAEGIETSLACLKMGFRPVWAALSASGIGTFPVLPGIEALTIFADNDHSKAGLVAARTCASSWSKAGREVTIIYPPRPGTDFADWMVTS